MPGRRWICYRLRYQRNRGKPRRVLRGRRIIAALSGADVAHGITITESEFLWRARHCGLSHESCVTDPFHNGEANHRAPVFTLPSGTEDDARQANVTSCRAKFFVDHFRGQGARNAIWHLTRNRSYHTLFGWSVCDGPAAASSGTIPFSTKASDIDAKSCRLATRHDKLNSLDWHRKSLAMYVGFPVSSSQVAAALVGTPAFV